MLSPHNIRFSTKYSLSNGIKIRENCWLLLFKMKSVIAKDKSRKNSTIRVSMSGIYSLAISSKFLWLSVRCSPAIRKGRRRHLRWSRKSNNMPQFWGIIKYIYLQYTHRHSNLKLKTAVMGQNCKKPRSLLSSLKGFSESRKILFKFTIKTIHATYKRLI